MLCPTHHSEQAALLHVGRARKNLHQRILRQRLRRTRSSALRRTLLAVLLTGDGKWTEGASLDSRRRVVLDTDAEDRLTAAAAGSDLRERAETNTRAMLTGLARSLGVAEVEVRFAEPADSAG